MAFFLPSRKVQLTLPKQMPGELASAEKRLYACACDLLLIVFFLVLLQQLQWLLLLQLLYFSFFWWRNRGKTIGNYFFHIQVVTIEKKSLPFKTAIIRSIGFLVSELTLIGLVWILFDKKRQGWHDKLAKTIVINI